MTDDALYEDEESGFLPPQRALDRMKMGGSMLKLTDAGVANKRHFRISPDLKTFMWLPSEKSEFLDLESVLQVVTGVEDPCFGKLKVDSALAATFFRRNSDSRADLSTSTYNMSGFLTKKGGSKGGRRNWTSRWHVLSGSTMEYFKNPKDAKPKGSFNIAGATVTETLEGKYKFAFEVKLVTDETRYFRADTQESARDWMGIIRKAALIKVGTAPARDAPGRSPSGRPLSTKGRSPSLEPVDYDLENRALSLIGKPGKKSLHLVCASADERAFWFEGLQGLVAFHRASADASIEVYTEAVSRNSSDPVARISLGMALLRQERIPEALDHLAQAVELSPNNIEARRGLSKALEKAGRLDDAMVHSRKAVDLRPKDPDLLVLLASHLQKARNNTDAIYYLQVAINVDPSCKEAHIRLADTLSAAGREDEAKSHYEEALRVDPNYKWGHVNLGLSLERQGNMAEAVESYVKALALDPNFVLALFNLGQAHDRLGNPVESFRCYEKCLQLQPTNIMYLTQVGFNRMSVNIDDALPVFEKAVGIAGTPSTHMNFGFCLMAKVFGVEAAQASTLPPAPAWAPELDRAVEQFTAGIGRDAGLLKARYWLALLLHRKGDSTAAGKQLWEVHQRDKGFPDPAGLNTSLAAQVAEAGAMSSPALPKPAGGVEDGGGTPVVADSDDGVEAGTGGGGGGAGDSGDPGSGGAGAGAGSGRGADDSFEGAIPMFGMSARQFMAPALSAEERQKEFIAAMKRDKEAAEAEAKRKKEAEWAALGEEERKLREEEAASTAKHEVKKEKMLTSQLKLYGSSNAARGGGRGRGRGRGK